MEKMVLIAIIALVILFVVAYASSLVFKIYNNHYYRMFHFLGGGFTFMLFFGLTSLTYFSFFMVVLVGFLWEVHEYLMWKFVWKKSAFKPKPKDTSDDLLMDTLGAVLFYLLLR